jgi:hypothetical protein
LTPVAVGGGAVVLVNGAVVAGILLLLAAVALAWLARLWVVPRSADAYAAKAERILATAFAKAYRANNGQAEKMATICDEISSLTPSQALEGEHRKIVRALAGHDRHQDSLPSLAERTTRVVRSRRAFREIEETASRVPSDPYLRSLVEHGRQRGELATLTTRLTEEPLFEGREALAGLHPPRAWRSPHHALLAAFDAYLAGVCGYYDATASDDTKMIARAISRFADSKADLDAMRLAYRDRLANGHRDALCAGVVS